MVELIAKLISVLSSPPLIAIPFTYSVILRNSQDSSYALQWTFISCIFVALVGLFIFYGVKSGMYTNFDISKREQRNSIFLFAGILATIYIAVVLYFKGPVELLISLIGFLMGVLVAVIVNTRIKASIHLAVFSSFAVVLGLLYGGMFWLLLIFAPVVAWSRVKLRRHLISETIVGTILGATIVLFLYYVIKYFS